MNKIPTVKLVAVGLWKLVMIFLPDDLASLVPLKLRLSVRKIASLGFLAVI
jgi:hypothetical protein